jgi:asparagine synthase (glutamine-hydrolysing)
LPLAETNLKMAGAGSELATQALRGVDSTASAEPVPPRSSTRKRAKYWQMAFDEGASPPFEALKREFLATLRHAVEDSTNACDPGEIGAFLSGGTDSSTLACLLGQVTGRPARTYSIGVDAAGYDEMA